MASRSRRRAGKRRTGSTGLRTRDSGLGSASAEFRVAARRSSSEAESRSPSPEPRSPNPESRWPSPSRRLRILAPYLVALVALAIFANALANGFALDDRGVILRNPLVQSLDGVWRAFAHPYWPKDVTDAGVYRPLAIASYAIDWAISGGDPRWFHALNVLWHAAATVLVYLVAARLLAPAGALLAGLIFAVHPVHVEAVANVVGRAECMAAVFVLGALLAHRRRHWLAPLLLVLALASKESAIVFLLLAPAADLLLEREPRGALRARRWLYASYAGIAMAYAATLATVFNGREFTQIAPVFVGLSMLERLLTVATIIPEYPRLLLAPFSLSWDYSPRVIDSARTVTLLVIAGIGVVFIYLVLLRRAWKRDRALAFALIWVAIALGPVSNVLIPTGIAVAERTLYLPSVGIAIAAGWLFQRAALRRMAPTVLGAAILIVTFSARSWTRTPVWRSNQTLAISLLETRPESYRAHQAVARVYAGMGRWGEAAGAYRTSRDLFQRDPTVYREAAVTAVQLGRVEEARALLDTAIVLHPRYAEARALRDQLALSSRPHE